MALRTLKTHVLVLSLLLLAPAPLPLASAADAPYEVATIGGGRLPLEADATTLSLSDDTVTSAFGLGFTTKFFGRATDLFWVGSNGFITLHFLTPDGCCEGAPIPTPGGPDGIIAGWWTDLDPSSGGTVRFDHQTLEGQPALVVDYDHVPVKGSTATATFQIVLLRSGVFEIRVEDAASAPLTFASVGAEDLGGNVGIQVLRETGASVADSGFRFTPIFVPQPPPQLLEIVPSVAGPGAVVQARGANFSADAFVLVDGVTTPSFVSSAATIFFLVPSLPDGTYDVTVGHPDGNSSTLPQSLTITTVLFIDGFGPNPIRQGDVLGVSGGGFEGDVTLLVGSLRLPARTFGTTFLQATIPDDLAPGFYGVGVETFEGVAFASDALQVLGRPDLAVTALDVSRHAPPEPYGVAPEYPEPWTVRVVVENLGDEAATDVEVTVLAQPTSTLLLSTPPERAARAFATVPAGDVREVVVALGDGTEVGDWSFVAGVSTRGVGDRNLSNNARAEQRSVGVGGFGGLAVSPCDRAPNACLPPEERSHRLEERDQVDAHETASLRLDASMATADFDFNNFPIVFSSFEPLPGGFRECTTWRFLGGSDGTFRVTMDVDNGIAGNASVPFASNRSSVGTQRTTTWTDVRAFGVILAESDRSSTDETPSEPLTSYEFAPDASWSLQAQGLTGDFTHCAIRDFDDAHEEFTFAALPADPSVLVASFSGNGFAEDVVVEVHAATDHQESKPLL